MFALLLLFEKDLPSQNFFFWRESCLRSRRTKRERERRVEVTNERGHVQAQQETADASSIRTAEEVGSVQNRVFTLYKNGYYYQKVFGNAEGTTAGVAAVESSRADGGGPVTARPATPSAVSGPHASAGGIRDWNSEFQGIVDALHEIQQAHHPSSSSSSSSTVGGGGNGAETLASETLALYSKLSRLAKDFVYVAKEYGKIIIMERDLVRFGSVVVAGTTNQPTNQATN
jgi:hypothetical protein